MRAAACWGHMASHVSCQTHQKERPPIPAAHYTPKMLRMLRTISRSPITVSKLPQPRGQPSSLMPSLLPRLGAPNACFSSVTLKPLLRPDVGQLRQGSVTLRGSLFGDSSHWEQVAGGLRLRLRTGEHSRHPDPRGDLLRKFASSQSDRELGTAAAAEQQQAEAQPASSGNGGHHIGSYDGAVAAALHHAREPQHGGTHADAHNGAGAQHLGHAANGHGLHGAPGGGGEGPPEPAWKLRLGRYLESNECHMVVITLVMLDLTIVVTELILGSFFAHGQPMPHAVHVAEEILSWSSIGILGIFATELLAKLTCFGTQFFAHSKWHMVDAVVVALSLILELTLKGVAQEAASLLMFFRLWKYTPEFMRVARHTPEMARAARHAPEVARILSHTPEFMRVFRHSPELARILSHTPDFFRGFRHAPEALRVFRHVPEFFRFVRHTPELFRLWRVARIAHASAAAMELHGAKEQEEQRHLLAQLHKDLAAEKGRVQVLEAELAAIKQLLTPQQQEEVAQALRDSVPGAGANGSSAAGSLDDSEWAGDDAAPNKSGKWRDDGVH